MRYYIVSGEKSGEMHAANLVKELKKLDPHAEFRGWGGEEMQALGVSIARHYKDVAFMGVWEVLKNLSTISRYIKQCKQDILAYQPDVLILVDYAGVNLRLARFASENGISAYYYISPKVWAWRQSRAYKIKKYVERMFVIMPFEKAFYKKFGYEVDYVGNPLFDAIAAYKGQEQFLEKNQLGSKPIIALLPGSRKQELKGMLEPMAACAAHFPDYQFVVAGVKELPQELYEPAKKRNLPIVYGQTYDLLKHAKAAFVTSGTATLETALFEVPQVVCYKTSWLTYTLAKMVIKVKYISLVNLLADKALVVELIQKELKESRMVEELKKVLGAERERIISEYRSLKKELETESASAVCAQKMWQYLQEKQRKKQSIS